MLRSILFVIKMQSQCSLNTTRLSMALVDLPLTPIGMKNRIKKRDYFPSGKENIGKMTSLQRKFKDRTENSTDCQETAKTAVQNSYSDGENLSCRTRDSIYTQIDDGSFVEFFMPRSVATEKEKPLFVTCLTNNDTNYSTSSKLATAPIGFRQYVEAVKNRQRVPVGPDETIISGSMANTGKRAPNQALNSTAINGSFWNYDFPDISALTVNTKLPTVDKEKSVIIIDDSFEQPPVFTIPPKKYQNVPKYPNKLSELENSLITEDASICSSNIVESSPHQVVTSSLERVSGTPSSPKRDLLTWVITSPFKSTEKGKSDVDFLDKCSQNLQLRLSESSSGTSGKSCLHEHNERPLTVGRDATSPKLRSTKPFIERRIKKRWPAPVIVPDSDEESSENELLRPTRRNLHAMIDSSSSSSSSNDVSQSANEDNFNNDAVKDRLSNDSKISLHLDTLDNSNQSRKEINLVADVSESDEDGVIATSDDEEVINIGRPFQNRLVMTSDSSSSDDESLPARKSFKSKTVEIISSDDHSDDSVQVISDSEEDIDTFSDLRSKLNKLIRPTSIKDNSPPNTTQAIFTTPCRTPLSSVKPFNNPTNSIFKTPLSSGGRLFRTPYTNKISDETFNTSSSDEDCSFVRKKTTPRCTKLNKVKQLDKNHAISVYEHVANKGNYIAMPFQSTVSFLSSLSRSAKDPNLHPDAIPFLKAFNRIKLDLVEYLYKYFNMRVFEGSLPSEMNIKWNPRMRKTAGFCYYQISKKAPSGRDARIELSSKVIDSADRLRDTLIHEMCHAASWIVSGYKCGHGPLWKAWVSKAMLTFPDLPNISRCHSYQISCKFTYECTKCGYSIGRHSKSLDVEKKVCGRCYGTFRLLVTSTVTPASTPKPPRTPGPFAVFVKENYSSVKKVKGGIVHGDVMKELSKQFNLMKLPKPKND